MTVPRGGFFAAVLSAALAAIAISGLSATRPLTLLRSDGPWLPESIARETAAAVARAEDWLMDHDSGNAIFPSPSPSLPWSDSDAFDAALAVLDAEIDGRTPPTALCERVRRHLVARRRLPSGRAASPALVADVGSALAACALGAIGMEHPIPDLVPVPPHGTQPDPTRVAAAALLRLCDGSAPRAAVLAHARWLAARLALGQGPANEQDRPDEALTPQSALLVALIATQLPMRELADPANELFSIDWRIRLADRLLALQVWDSESGGFMWNAADGIDNARATRCAILALRLLLTRLARP